MASPPTQSWKLLGGPWTGQWVTATPHLVSSMDMGGGQDTARRSLQVGVWAPVGNVLSGPEPRRKEWQQGGKQPQLVRTEKEGAATAGSWKSQALRPPPLPAPLSPRSVGTKGPDHSPGADPLGHHDNVTDTG